MPFDKLTSPVTWKLEEHRDLLQAGLKHNLVLDAVSGNYRKKSYQKWIEYPKIYAESAGCYFTQDTPSRTLKEIFVDEDYNVEGFIPKKGDLVIDIGANYGDSAVWWSIVHSAKIIAFEPLDNVFEILSKNVKLNSANVELHKTALGDGKILKGYSNGDMFISGTKGNEVNFNSSRLDDYSFDKIDILKIDVEGFEVGVLKGGLKTISKHLPKIILETHSKELKRECLAMLSGFGYSIMYSGRIAKSGSPGMDEVQNLFLAKV